MTHRPAAETQVLGVRWTNRDELAGWTAVAILGGVAFLALRIFGLPGVDLHTPLHYAGIMDPLCGMTRAMRLLAIGDFASAWRYNPGSFPVAAFGVLFTARFAMGLATRRWLTWQHPSRRVTWSLALVATTMLWINQQANADLLMSRGLS